MPRFSRVKAIWILGALTAYARIPISAEVITWTGGAGDGKWTSSANWDLGRAPAAGDDVVIDLSGTFTVTLDIDATVNSISLGASNGAQTLRVASHTLALDGPGASNVSLHGNLQLVSSTLNLAAEVSNSGTLVGAGASVINNTASFTNLTGATLRVYGNSSDGDATLTIDEGFSNAGLIELICDTVNFTWQSRLFVTNGTLLNESGGELRISPGTGGGPRLLAAQLDNQGTINVNHPCTIDKSSADHTSSGTIDVAGGDLTLTQSGTTPGFTNTGTITIGSGRTLTISGGTFDHDAGAIGGDGGTLALTSTTANFGTDFTNGAVQLVLKSMTFNGPGILTNAGTLTVISSTINADLINQNGALLICGGVGAINGDFTQASGATLRIRGDNSAGNTTLTVAAGFSNPGLIELISGNQQYFETLDVSSGTLLNTGEIRISQGTGGVRTLQAQLDNQGTININQPCTIDKSSADHMSSGTIAVAGGDLTVTQTGTTPSFTNSGTMDVSAGRTLTVQSGRITQTSGRLLLAGNLTLTNVTFELAGGALMGTGTVSGTVDNAGGTVAPGFSVGALTINGEYVQGADGTLAIELAGDQEGEFDRLIVSGTATLDGLLDATPIEGFAPEGGDRFTFLEAGQRVGEFGVINPNCKLGPVRVEYGDTSATLVIISSSRGDLNCDCSIDFNDIDPFVVALIGRESYENQYPDCDFGRGDVNCDGSVDFDDIDGFVTCIINGECDPCP